VYLESIEEGQYDKMPGIAYTVGFIRSYAEYLGLDADKLVRDFNKENRNEYYKDQLSDDDEDSMVEAKDEIANENCEEEVKKLKFSNGKLWMILAVVLLLLFVAGFGIYKSIKHSKKERNLVEGVKDSSDKPYFIEEKEVLNKEREKEKDENVFEEKHKVYGNVEAQEIRLQAASEVWIQITDTKTDRVLFSKILLQGDEFRTEGSADYVLTVGNAGGLRVIVGGMDLGALGNEGQKKVGIVLEKQELLRDH
jgi:cytoskeletal protein RodZ